MSQNTKMSQKSNTKVSDSWSNIEITQEASPPTKSTKRDKKRNKTGKSEKRTQKLRKNKITFSTGFQEPKN